MPSTIPFDPFNPGHVFACLGLAEAADLLCAPEPGRSAGVRARFEMGEQSSRFHVETSDDRDVVGEVLHFLYEAEVVTLGASGEKGPLETSKWSIPTEAVEPGEAFPNGLPTSPAALPVELRAEGRALRFAHWGDTTVRDNMKFWAGAGGYPGAALLNDALVLVKAGAAEVQEDPFAFSAVQSSSFRLDWRRDYIPIDAGFSLNKHGQIHTVGYPLVEILAALGLSHARPSREHKLRYYYGCLTDPDGRLLPLSILRAGLGGSRLSPFEVRRFRMELANPGKDDRCIIQVYEESHS